MLEILVIVASNQDNIESGSIENTDDTSDIQEEEIHI